MKLIFNTESDLKILQFNSLPSYWITLEVVEVLENIFYEKRAYKLEKILHELFSYDSIAPMVWLFTCTFIHYC